jgi:hypothetical protein
MSCRLLYTAAPDSEGTLGGFVELGNGEIIPLICNTAEEEIEYQKLVN